MSGVSASPSTIAQALADPVRFRIVERLADAPAAVSELVLLSGESQSNVSNHLAVLRAQGLVTVTRIGRQRVYEVADPSVGQLVESLGMIAGRGSERLKLSPALARARTCYDLIAGRWYSDRRASGCFAASASSSMSYSASAASLRPRAATGASAGHTSAALWGPPCGSRRSNTGGSSASRAPA